MSEYYTEDDVTAAYAVYDSPEVECPHADPSWYVAECDHCRTARVLAAVAPAIAARALRKAADAMQNEKGVTFADALMIRWLRARAEELRNGSATARETVVQFDMDPRLPVSEGSSDE